MKKKVTIILIILLFGAAIVYFGSTLRIRLEFDENGNLLTGSGMFTLTIEGSDNYTDKELAEYLFGESIEANPFVLWWNDWFGEHVEIPFIEAYEVEAYGITDYKITFYDKSIVGCMEYMGSNKYFDKDGIVVESSDVQLDGIPCVTGIDVDYIVMNSKLPVENEEIFDILLNITQLITKYEIIVDRINISKDMDIKIYLENVRVDLGMGDNLSEKIMNLNDIIPTLGNVKGVLDMTEYDEQGNGYTLKKEE